MAFPNSPPKRQKQIPEVIFQPETFQGMQRGIQKIVNAIAPTLGPIHRTVIIEKESKVGRPEILDDGATIARRIIQLPQRDEDMGAMYLRQLLWALHESVGDGSATAALMFQTVYQMGISYIINGGDAVRLRQTLETACTAILDELETMSFSVQGKEALTRLAETICYDPELARMLGEIFDVIGEFGRLDILIGHGRSLEREYIEGMYWNGPVQSREMIPNPRIGRAQLENPAILMSDLEIHDPQVMVGVMRKAIESGAHSLLLIAKSISDPALALLLMKPNQEKIHVVAVKAPGLRVDDQREGLEDLAVLAGGRVFWQAAGDGLERLRPEDFGHARRAWADHQYFGISGGKGDPRNIRTYIAALRAAFSGEGDPQQRKRLQERIGKLLAGSAVLWIGDPSPIGAEARKQLAERTAEAMRGAILSGVLPGGEAALFACKKGLLEKYHQAQQTDERAAYRILAAAVEAPIRVLLENAGENPDELLPQIAAFGRGFGYDVLKRKITDMTNEGLVDSAAVIREAAYRAVRGAALALTVDVLVHRANPPEVYHTV